MATTYSKKIRAAAVAGVSALTLSSAALLAAPAQAETGLLDYTCEVPILGTQTFQVNLATNAPATLPSTGSVTVNGTATVIVPETLVGTMTSALGVAEIDGTGTVVTALDGAAKTSTVTMARTAAPASGAMTVTASGPLMTVTAGAAGSTHTITATSFSAAMDLYTADGTKLTADGPFLIPCSPAVANPVVDTIEVGPALASKTKVKGKYVKAKKTVEAAVTVTGPKTGKVTVALKSGKKTVKTVKVNLKNGKATAKFTKVTKKGSYTIEAKLPAGNGYKASAGKTSVRVK